MADYRRNYRPGGTFFFTLVTEQRRAILAAPAAVGILRRAVRDELRARPFRIDAAVVLPDHLHMIWTLPRDDSDYSVRWGAIKAAFTRAWLGRGGEEAMVSEARRRQGYRGVWQRRFLEHTCRDEEDYADHVDYIHFNPVKHGLVDRPADWPYSSIHAYIRRGVLPTDWGAGGGFDVASEIDAELWE